VAEQHEFWVYSEKPALLAELIAAARSLTEGPLAAVVTGPRTDAETALAQGADKVYWLGETGPERLVDDYIPTLAALITGHKPYGLLIGATRRGKAVAGRLAARLDASAITDVKAFEWADGILTARHLVFGGGAVRVEHAKSALFLATLGKGLYEPLPADASRAGEIVEIPFEAPTRRPRLCEVKPKMGSTVNLAAARRVVCPGRGLAKQEDLKMIDELAQVLEAEIGCTRPLAEGLDWLPRERYIGVSGAFIKPDLYLGIGVSGQVQHTVGLSETRVMVAINKDEHAPLFEQADYGIVGDLYTLVPALTAALKARRS